MKDMFTTRLKARRLVARSGGHIRTGGTAVQQTLVRVAYQGQAVLPCLFSLFSGMLHEAIDHEERMGSRKRNYPWCLHTFYLGPTSFLSRRCSSMVSHLLGGGGIHAALIMAVTAKQNLMRFKKRA